MLFLIVNSLQMLRTGIRIAAQATNDLVFMPVRVLRHKESFEWVERSLAHRAPYSFGSTGDPGRWSDEDGDERF